MATRSPRKRRMVRVWDRIYGDGTRGSFQNYSMERNRSNQQKESDTESYASSGAPSYLTASCDVSGTQGTGGRIDINGAESLYNDGSGSFAFACWFKPKNFNSSGSIPPPTGSTVFAFSTGSNTNHNLEYAVSSGSSGSFRMNTNFFTSSGGTVWHSFTSTTLTGTVDTWNFAGFSGARSGSNYSYRMVLNNSSSVNDFVAAQDNFNIAHIGNLISGAVGTTRVGWRKASLGHILQAAFWNVTKSMADFELIRNSGVPEPWFKWSPLHYWVAGEGGFILKDYGSANSISGSIVSGSIEADVP